MRRPLSNARNTPIAFSDSHIANTAGKNSLCHCILKTHVKRYLLNVLINRDFNEFNQRHVHVVVVDYSLILR